MEDNILRYRIMDIKDSTGVDVFAIEMGKRIVRTSTTNLMALAKLFDVSAQELPKQVQ